MGQGEIPHDLAAYESSCSVSVASSKSRIHEIEVSSQGSSSHHHSELSEDVLGVPEPEKNSHEKSKKSAKKYTKSKRSYESVQSGPSYIINEPEGTKSIVWSRKSESCDDIEKISYSKKLPNLLMAGVNSVESLNESADQEEEGDDEGEKLRQNSVEESPRDLELSQRKLMDLDEDRIADFAEEPKMVNQADYMSRRDQKSLENLPDWLQEAIINTETNRPINSKTISMSDIHERIAYDPHFGKSKNLESPLVSSKDSRKAEKPDQISSQQYETLLEKLEEQVAKNEKLEATISNLLEMGLARQTNVLNRKITISNEEVVEKIDDMKDSMMKYFMMLEMEKAEDDEKFESLAIKDLVNDVIDGAKSEMVDAEEQEDLKFLISENESLKNSVKLANEKLDLMILETEKLGQRFLDYWAGMSFCQGDLLA